MGMMSRMRMAGVVWGEGEAGLLAPLRVLFHVPEMWLGPVVAARAACWTGALLSMVLVMLLLLLLLLLLAQVLLVEVLVVAELFLRRHYPPPPRARGSRR